MSAIAAIERDTGISVMPALARLQDRIERSLQRSQSSTLPEDRVALLRSNLRNMVSEKVSEIPDIVSKRVVEREDGTNRIDRNDRWIVNDNIVSAF
ncbi:MAG TPA: hypothetical protein PK765_04850 [bacterium]|nr:hypothetical protein [bacterium]